MSEQERKFLEIVDLKKGFGSGDTRQEVLKGMNFTVSKGEFCVLLGPSGSGKSTLMYCLSTLKTPTEGSIVYNGKELTSIGNAQRESLRRREFGFIFQNILKKYS